MSRQRLLRANNSGSGTLSLAARLRAATGSADVAQFLYGVNATVSGGVLTTWADALSRSPSIGSTGTARLTDNGTEYVADGVNDFANGMFTVSAMPVTVYLVVKQITWVSGKQLMDGGANDQMGLYQDAVSPNLGLFVTSGSTASPVVAAPIGSFVVVTLSFAATTSTIQVNDGTAGSVTTGAARTVTGLTLARAGSSSANFTNAAYKAAMVCAGAQSAGQKAAVKALLYSTYGITP